MSNLLFDFSAHGTLNAVGDDALTFLHNLSTNDVKKLPPRHGCEAFFCTATAKVVGQAWIWREPPEGKRETLWLDTPPGLHEKLYAHLKRYIIGEDVELTDRTADFGRLYLASENAGDLLGAGGAVPMTFTQAEGGTVIRRRDLFAMPGYDILGSPDEIADVRQTLLSAGAVAAGPEQFEALRIEAGLPWWGADIDETTFAPETGRIGQAISYAKGCYLGQEPIVMARDRGVVQRSLVGLEVGDAPLTGVLTRDGKEVGRATSSAFSPRLGRAIALGYVKRGNQAPATELQLGDRTVRVATLPFA